MVTLLILDGFGYSERLEGNAIRLQGTPNLDKLDAYPHTLIEASGEAVGLTKGLMGNSEVGHMNLGAGRVIYQGKYKIDKAIEDGSFFNKDAFLGAIDHAKKNNSSLHFIGLCSDGGVHSHINHLKALVDLASKKGVKKVYIHFIGDGRDTPVDSGADFLKKIMDFSKGKAEVVDIIGRVYAMDREKRYDRVKVAYDLYVDGIAETKGINDPITAIKKSYENGVYDEFVRPILLSSKGRVQDNDAVIFFNFRTDRAREITDAFTQDTFTGFERKKLNNLYYCCMTKYDESFKGVHIAFETEVVEDNLSAILSAKGLRQFHVSETTKYAHVTFFFNGGIEKPYKNEDRKLIDTINVQSFAEYPEMRAKEITDSAIEAIKSKKYDFVLINLSNPDMLGHTGDIEATKKAIKLVDKCAYDIAMETIKAGGDAIVTADHGNAEEMIDEKGNMVTSHTTNPVKLWLVSEKNKSVKLMSGGKLANVAPTVLKLLNLKPTDKMEKPLF